MPSRAAATRAVSPAQPAVSAPSPVAQASAPSQASSWVHAAPPAVSLSHNNLVSASPGSTNAAGGGEPMHAGTQGILESSYRASLYSVRVHSDAHGQDLAQSLSARAVTYGNHIFLGPGERQTDLRLMAHETAHVLQQRAAPVVHLWAPGEGSNSYEHEAHQAADAVMRHESFNVQQRTAEPQAQRLGLSDALNYFADKANLIPGFRMFTIVIGMNPINGASVDRSPGNIIRAIVEFLPGGGFVVQALESSGVFDKVGNWVAGQLRSLGMVGSAFKKGIDDFLHSLSWRDIFHLGSLWDRAKGIFTGPISQLINFVKGLIGGIIQFIKDAILKPIARLAEGTEGYNLLKGILGKDPITGEAVPRSAETLLGPLLRMIGLGDVWQKMQQAKAIPRAWAWFQSTMGQLVGFVSQIPGLFVKAFKSLTIEDIILVPKAFAKLAGVFGGFLGKFVSWGLDAMFKLLEIVFDVVSPGAFAYIKKTGGALKAILKNPLPFIGNLVKAAKLGFMNFGGNFLTHLKKGLIDWLTGSLEGVYIPRALTLPEFGKLAISVLGVSWAQIRAKIVKALGPSGETIMKVLETTFDVVMALINGGPAAAWEVIKDKLNDLKDQVVDGIIGFIKETVVTKAIPKLISMFIPGAGFISAIISIYDTVMVFVNKISKIVQVVTAFLNSIVAIAAGNIGAAAAKVESILAGLLSLAISFLAGFVGLGKVTGKIMEVVNKVRAKVDKAIDAGVNWIVNAVKKLGGMIKGKDARTPEEKQRDLDRAVRELTPILQPIIAKGAKGRIFRARLMLLKRQYRLTELAVAGGKLRASINPTADMFSVEEKAMGAALEPLLAQAEAAHLGAVGQRADIQAAATAGTAFPAGASQEQMVSALRQLPPGARPITSSPDYAYQMEQKVNKQGRSRLHAPEEGPYSIANLPGLPRPDTRTTGYGFEDLQRGEVMRSGQFWQWNSSINATMSPNSPTRPSTAAVRDIVEVSRSEGNLPANRVATGLVGLSQTAGVTIPVVTDPTARAPMTRASNVVSEAEITYGRMAPMATWSSDEAGRRGGVSQAATVSQQRAIEVRRGSYSVIFNTLSNAISQNRDQLIKLPGRQGEALGDLAAAFDAWRAKYRAKQDATAEANRFVTALQRYLAATQK